MRRLIVGSFLTFGAGLGMGLLDGAWGTVHGAGVVVALGAYLGWVRGF